MSTLYEITGQFQYLLDMMDDPECDPRLIEDSLQALSGEFEFKADGYAKVRAELMARSAALKSEIDRLTTRKRSIDKNVERIMDTLKMAMISTGKTKFKTDLFSFGLQKNPPRMVKDVEDYRKYPPELRIQRDPEVNWVKVREYLNDPDEYPFLKDLVHMEQGQSVRIR